MILTRKNYISNPHPIESELRLIFDTQKSLVIFDIGSCEGEDSIRCSRIFPNARIFAVEPLPNNVKLIEANIDKYAVNNVEILPFALSDQMGISNFYVSSGQPEDSEKNRDWDYGNKSSSLLSPSKYLETISWLKFNNIINVQTKTLERVCTEKKISSIDFIHMDVQGAELKVLSGAKKLIKNTKVIWLEVEAVELYKDQPLKQEIESFMRENNFYKVKDTVKGVSGDQLYINSIFYSNKLILLWLLLIYYLQSYYDNFSKLKMFLSTRASKIKHYFHSVKKSYRISYSQCGEDLLVRYIFDVLSIKNPSYIDIGAHDPEYINNTAIFYLNGSRGINIEPDPVLFQKFKNKRKHDINLNIGIADTFGELDFYFMSAPTLNTFSKSEADRCIELNYLITAVDKIKVDTLSHILQKYWNNQFPDFLSLDVEGMDEIILKSIDYTKSYPIVICVETISFSENGSGIKNQSIIDFLEYRGYMVYADTYVNTIFVRKDRWIRL